MNAPKIPAPENHRHPFCTGHWMVKGARVIISNLISFSRSWRFWYSATSSRLCFFSDQYSLSPSAMDIRWVFRTCSFSRVPSTSMSEPSMLLMM